MIVDDHGIIRDGLRELLENAGDFEVVGQAENGATAVRVAQDLKPDVVVMDVLMPVKNGIEACREITDRLPDTHVLILTVATEEDAVIESVAAGAAGFLQKYAGKDEFLSAVRDVAGGEYRIPGDVIKRVFTGIRATARRAAPPDLEKLTAREQEILTLFAKGLSYAAIGEVRGSRPLTIRNAIYGIQNKLGTKTKQEMVVWAVRSGLLDNGSKD
ncbi:MAG: response regulator transcription factor [Chloroflexi bacterium]|nr:response regulator transcription factor [Chloroflexota bacterium]MYK35241.1 response regulator transcription factor [Chloroflexota bacterium]